MHKDPEKKFYPEPAGLSRRQIANRIIMLSKAGHIPNFGQEGLGVERLMLNMNETEVQIFVNQIGQMQLEQHDYASLEDWQRHWYYRYARFTEDLMHEAHRVM